MKKFFKVLGIIILVLIIIVLVAGLIAPRKYHLEREITINAPREKVWPQVSSLVNMNKWSPFAEQDPNIKVSFEGQDGTVGSGYKWESEKVGAGEQKITKLDQPNRADSHLHFIKPFEGEAEAFIDLKEAGSATKVTWGFSTEYAYPMNAMLLVMNMDKVMGETFDKGLSNLKRTVESN
jgi:hypothetical protein